MANNFYFHNLSSIYSSIKINVRVRSLSITKPGAPDVGLNAWVFAAQNTSLSASTSQIQLAQTADDASAPLEALRLHHLKVREQIGQAPALIRRVLVTLQGVTLAPATTCQSVRTSNSPRIYLS